MCHGNIVHFNFTMSWFASNLQQPGKKVYCCMVLRGREGAGKGIFIQLMKQMMGSKYHFQPSSAEEIMTGSNSSISGKKIVLFK